jgi:hypothetical protein
MNPEDYFRKYLVEESLLLRYRYDERTQAVFMTFDLAEYSMRSLSADGETQKSREVHRIRFNRVSDYRRYDIAPIYIMQESFDSAREIGSNAIYDVKPSKAGNRYSFSARLTNFGTVEFRYEELRAEVKTLLLVSPEGPPFKYVDASTGAPVDFFNPFKE